MHKRNHRGITRERLASMKSRRDVLVADVRTPEYFRNGSIDGSVNLYPIRKFANQLQAIKNKKQPVVIVSSDVTDEDAEASMMYAERLGFENVYLSDFVSLRDE